MKHLPAYSVPIFGPRVRARNIGAMNIVLTLASFALLQKVVSQSSICTTCCLWDGVQGSLRKKLDCLVMPFKFCSLGMSAAHLIFFCFSGLMRPGIWQTRTASCPMRLAGSLPANSVLVVHYSWTWYSITSLPERLFAQPAGWSKQVCSLVDPCAFLVEVFGWMIWTQGTSPLLWPVFW